jgi:membrane-associated protease RseP (regulator of RpoE activity)
MVHKPKAMSFVKALAAMTLLLVLPPVARKAISQDEAAPAPPAVRVRSPRPPAPPAPPAPPESPEARDRHGWLGVTLSEDEDGVRVDGVEEGSPAEKAGLQEGDRILEMEGRRMATSRDVRRAVRDLEPGDAMQIRIERKSKERTLTATLGERPDDFNVLRDYHRLMPEGDFEPGPFWMDASRNYIGVQVQSMTEDLRAYFKAPRGRGLLVSKVKDGTPAAKAGLRAGDVIIAADGKEVSDRGDLREALADHEPGDKVSIRIVRDGSEKTVDVEIARREGPGMRHGSMSLPDDREMWIEGIGKETSEQIHQALEQAMKEIERTKLERAEVHRQIHEAMEQLQLSRQDREKLRRQIRDAMQQAREAVRQATESFRGFAPASI